MSTIATELSATEWRAFANRPDTQEHMSAYGHIDATDNVDDETWLRQYQGHGSCWTELIRYYESVNPQPPVVAEEKMIPESTFPDVSPDPVVIVEEPDVDSLRDEIRGLRAALSNAQADRQTAVDDALRDVARKAARIAANAGYCGEYDRIAAGVGLPTRDELFERRYEHRVEVTLRVTLTMTGDEDPDWDDDDIYEALRDKTGYNLRYDVDALDWEIEDSEEGALYDPETGEELSED